MHDFSGIKYMSLFPPSVLWTPVNLKEKRKEKLTFTFKLAKILSVLQFFMVLVHYFWLCY